MLIKKKKEGGKGAFVTCVFLMSTHGSSGFLFESWDQRYSYWWKSMKEAALKIYSACV